MEPARRRGYRFEDDALVDEIASSGGTALAIQAARAAVTPWDVVTVAESFTGFVFGMQQTDVNPPAAAAFVPLMMSSLYSRPGSRRWTCMSINPGTTIIPVASITFASSAGLFNLKVK